MTFSSVPDPAELKKLDPSGLNDLCALLREKIISTVSRNGGHLSSNLGDVELTVALHRVLNCPKDKLLFDVGHQCYAHKLLTGRAERFDTLRCTGGICGFPRREESEYDTFSTGHASNAISAALGLVRARDLSGENYKVVTVLGDGALTGGMAYEGLNDAGRVKTQLLVILNDNGMSISGNVGALNQYLTHLRLSKGWQYVKKSFSTFLRRIPRYGEQLNSRFQRIKDHIRNIFVHDTFFSALGFRYLGPVDGHDIQGLEKVIRKATELSEPVLLHVYTQKGRGFTPAEDKPDVFHGTPPFSIETGEASFSERFCFGRCAAETLTEAAKRDDRICVITAAMAQGTCMDHFAASYPDRFFDVGIAEEHAVTMAGGLSIGGMRPFVAIYDTFLQRGFDQIIEDICLQKVPVCFLCDRAGLGSNDGSSHHGVFGMSFLSAAPEMNVLMPCNLNELRQMILWHLTQNKPTVIRYPRNEPEEMHHIEFHFRPGRWETLRDGTDAAILCASSLLKEALSAADRLKKQGISLRVINASTLKPLDEELLKSLCVPFFTAEENSPYGSFASSVCLFCSRLGIPAPRGTFTLPDRFIPHGSHKDLLKMCGLDGESLAQKIAALLPVSQK